MNPISVCNTFYALTALLVPFSLQAATFTTLTSFSGSKDAAAPDSGTILVGNGLYGGTQYGGASGHGALFEIDPATHAQTRRLA